MLVIRPVWTTGLSEGGHSVLGKSPAQSNTSALAPLWDHLFRDISAVMSQFITFSLRWFQLPLSTRKNDTEDHNTENPKPQTCTNPAPAGSLRITQIAGWHSHSLVTSDLRAVNRLHQQDDNTKDWNIPESRSTDPEEQKTRKQKSTSSRSLTSSVLNTQRNQLLIFSTFHFKCN